MCSPPEWQAFATLVLEAVYEATLFYAVVNAKHGLSKRVLLTRRSIWSSEIWIDAAIRRALDVVSGRGRAVSSDSC